MYGIEVSPDLLSAVTDAALDEIAAWQGPARAGLPVVFVDALRVKIASGLGPQQAVHSALGVRADGTKEVRARGWSRTRAPSLACGS